MLKLVVYTNTPRDKRYCPLCNKREVKDEYHIFFICQHYSELRKQLIDFAINTIDNFIGLNESMKVGILSTSYCVNRKTSNFAQKVLEIRQKLLRT